eukprot:scaffold1724_cov246-Pinguiococcus_pyrenoidosus.AAC.2
MIVACLWCKRTEVRRRDRSQPGQARAARRDDALDGSSGRAVQVCVALEGVSHGFKGHIPAKALDVGTGPSLRAVGNLEKLVLRERTVHVSQRHLQHREALRAMRKAHEDSVLESAQDGLVHVHLPIRGGANDYGVLVRNGVELHEKLRQQPPGAGVVSHALSPRAHSVDLVDEDYGWLLRSGDLKDTAQLAFALPMILGQNPTRRHFQKRCIRLGRSSSHERRLARAWWAVQQHVARAASDSPKHTAAERRRHQQRQNHMLNQSRLGFSMADNVVES